MINKLFRRNRDEVTYFLKDINRGHHEVTYRGVKAIRNPFDYLIYQMIISEVRPDLIIEVGTNHGGSAFYMADLLDSLGHGMIHSIDITDRVPKEVKNHLRIKLFFDGWENYDLENTQGYDKILVIEDGSHMYHDSMGAMVKFKDLVDVGSYLIVEDGIIDELGLSQDYDGGPKRAISEFLVKYPEFEIDRKWCDFFGSNATFNVDGYLKRKY